MTTETTAPETNARAKPKPRRTWGNFAAELRDAESRIKQAAAVLSRITADEAGASQTKAFILAEVALGILLGE